MYKRIIAFFLLTLLYAPLCAVADNMADATRTASQSLVKENISRGNQRLLVVLVDFPDEPGKYTQQSFMDLFFSKDSQWSMRNYFKEVSYDQLHISGDIVGVHERAIVKNQNRIAYVRLPRPKSYYAYGSGGTNTSHFPRNLGGVFHHTIKALDRLNFDFSPYIQKSTNHIQNIMIVFAGRSSTESWNKNTLQPTGSSLTSIFAEGYGVTKAGYRYSKFTLCPESNAKGQTTIRVCAHEYAHSLGLPDLYDLSFQHSGAGVYSLMSYMTGDGSLPAHPGPYEKMQLQWLNPRNVQGQKQRVLLQPIETFADAIKLSVPGNPDEYFMLENKQLSGFQKNLKTARFCPGLYIWHIDEKIIAQYRNQNRVNTHPSGGGPPHPGIVLVEADGGHALTSSPLYKGDCQDAFAVGDSFGPLSKAQSTLWSGEPSGISVQVLKENNGVLTLEITTP